MHRDRFKHSGKNTAGDPTIVDGFVRRTPTPGGTPFQRTNRIPSSPKIDDFRRPEGFISRSRGTNVVIPDGTGVGRKPRYNNSHKGNLIKKHKPITHHGKKPGKVGFAFRKSVSTLLLAFLLGAGFLLGMTYLRATQIFQGGESALALNGELDPSLLKGEGDGRVNILLLGRGGSGHTAPDLTDTLMIASIDPIQKDAGLVSIPRDTYVQMPGNGSMKINAVYATAKQYAIAQGKNEKAAEDIAIKTIQQTVEEILGIPINYYGMIDFRGFERAINVVGGVDVDVKTAVYENMIINGRPYVLDVPVGRQHFSGTKALAYSRSRMTSARGDFDRSQRQREILVALRDKVFSVGTFGNPIKISQLFGTFGKHIKTNLSVEDLMKLYGIAQEIDGSRVKSIGLADPPNDYVTTGSAAGLSIVLPKEGLYMYDKIHHYIRNTLRDGFLRKEDAKVLVLNGTNTPGLATTHKTILRSYGYKVSGIGDAPSKNYAETRVIDLRDGEKKYTKRYLELRYKTTVTEDLPAGIDPGLADFVIIVGQNETGS